MMPLVWKRLLELLSFVIFVKTWLVYLLWVVWKKHSYQICDKQLNIQIRNLLVLGASYVLLASCYRQQLTGEVMAKSRDLL